MIAWNGKLRARAGGLIEHWLEATLRSRDGVRIPRRLRGRRRDEAAGVTDIAARDAAATLPPLDDPIGAAPGRRDSHSTHTSGHRSRVTSG